VVGVTDNQDEVLIELVKNFDDWLDATDDSREEAELSRDYYDGKQLSEDKLAALKKRKQPPIIDNMIKDKIEYVIGLELSSRSDPKAYPRTPKHEADAEAVTDALRYIGDANDFPTVKSDVAENAFIEGFGGAEVYAAPKRNEMDIRIKRNRWERCFYDPYSSERDFSDARYLGTFIWMDLEDAKAKWPKVKFWDAVEVAMKQGQGSDEDRPGDFHLDRSRRRVRVIEEYCRKGGKWYRAKFVKFGYVEAYGPSPWLDEDGEPEHPYCWISAYVDRENARYGLVRRYRDLQDEINDRRSKALHLLNVNQLWAEDGAFDDPQLARREASKPDGLILYRQGFEAKLEKNLDLALGQQSLMDQARQALSVTGPKASTSSSPNQSGRAKQIDRESDVLELGRLFDQIRSFQKQTYRKTWNRVRQFWTEEKWVRVRDDEGAPKFVALNQKQTAGEAAKSIMEKAQKDGLQDPSELTPEDQQILQIAQFQPDAVIRIKNATADLDVDISIDEAPDVVSLQQEQFTNLVDLARAGVVFPPEVYVEASALRNKKQIMEKLKGGDNPQAQAAAQAQAQLQQRGAEAQVAKVEAEVGKISAETQQKQIENMAGQAGLAGMATAAPPGMM